MLSFEFKLKYLKGVTLFFLVFSFAAICFQSFDPFKVMEAELLTAFMGTSHVAEQTLVPYRFAMALFGLVSVVAMLMQYYILHYAFPKRESWAYRVLLMGMYIWVIMAGAIIYYFNAYFYLKNSLIPFTILFLPVLISMRKDFK